MVPSPFLYKIRCSLSLAATLVAASFLWNAYPASAEITNAGGFTIGSSNESAPDKVHFPGNIYLEYLPSFTAHNSRFKALVGAGILVDLNTGATVRPYSNGMNETITLTGGIEFGFISLGGKRDIVILNTSSLAFLGDFDCDANLAGAQRICAGNNGSDGDTLDIRKNITTALSVSGFHHINLEGNAKFENSELRDITLLNITGITLSLTNSRFTTITGTSRADNITITGGSIDMLRGAKIATCDGAAGAFHLCGGSQRNGEEDMLTIGDTQTGIFTNRLIYELWTEEKMNGFDDDTYSESGLTYGDTDYDGDNVPEYTGAYYEGGVLKDSSGNPITRTDLIQAYTGTTEIFNPAPISVAGFERVRITGDMAFTNSHLGIVAITSHASATGPSLSLTGDTSFTYIQGGEGFDTVYLGTDLNGNAQTTNLIFTGTSPDCGRICGGISGNNTLKIGNQLTYEGALTVKRFDNTTIQGGEHSFSNSDLGKVHFENGTILTLSGDTDLQYIMGSEESDRINILAGTILDFTGDGLPCGRGADITFVRFCGGGGTNDTIYIIGNITITVPDNELRTDDNAKPDEIRSTDDFARIIDDWETCIIAPDSFPSTGGTVNACAAVVNATLENVAANSSYGNIDDPNGHNRGTLTNVTAVNVTLGSGNDEVSFAGGIYTGTISGGGGNDSLTLFEAVALGALDAGAGDDTITLGINAYLDFSSTISCNGINTKICGGTHNGTGDHLIITSGAGLETVTANRLTPADVFGFERFTIADPAMALSGFSTFTLTDSSLAGITGTTNADDYTLRGAITLAKSLSLGEGSDIVRLGVDASGVSTATALAITASAAECAQTVHLCGGDNISGTGDTLELGNALTYTGALTATGFESTKLYGGKHHFSGSTLGVVSFAGGGGLVLSGTNSVDHILGSSMDDVILLTADSVLSSTAPAINCGDGTTRTDHRFCGGAGRDRLVVNGSASIYGSTNFNPIEHNSVHGFEMIELRNIQTTGDISLVSLEELALISGRDVSSSGDTTTYTNRQDIDLGSGRITSAPGNQRVYIVGATLSSVFVGGGDDKILIAGNTDFTRDEAKAVVNGGNGTDIVILGGSYDDVYGEISLPGFDETARGVFPARVKGGDGPALQTTISINAGSTFSGGKSDADMLVFDGSPTFNFTTGETTNLTDFPAENFERMIIRGGTYSGDILLGNANSDLLEAMTLLSLEDVVFAGRVAGSHIGETIYLSGNVEVDYIDTGAGDDEVIIGKHLKLEYDTTTATTITTPTDKTTTLNFTGDRGCGAENAFRLCASGTNNTLTIGSLVSEITVENSRKALDVVATGFTTTNNNSDFVATTSDQRITLHGTAGSDNINSFSFSSTTHNAIDAGAGADFIYFTGEAALKFISAGPVSGDGDDIVHLGITGSGFNTPTIITEVLDGDAYCDGIAARFCGGGGRDRLVIKGTARLYGSTQFNPLGNALVDGFEMIELREFATATAMTLTVTSDIEELALISGRNGTTNRQDINLGNDGGITGDAGAQRLHLVGVNLGNIDTGDGKDTLLIAGRTDIRNNTSSAVNMGEGNDVVLLGGGYEDVYGVQSIPNLLGGVYLGPVDGTGGAPLATSISFGESARINGSVGDGDVLVFEDKPSFNFTGGGGGAAYTEANFSNFPALGFETLIIRGGNYASTTNLTPGSGTGLLASIRHLSLEDVVLAGAVVGTSSGETIYVSGNVELAYIDTGRGNNIVFIGKRLENDGTTIIDKVTTLNFSGDTGCGEEGAFRLCASGNNSTLTLTSLVSTDTTIAISGFTGNITDNRPAIIIVTTGSSANAIDAGTRHELIYVTGTVSLSHISAGPATSGGGDDDIVHLGINDEGATIATTLTAPDGNTDFCGGSSTARLCGGRGRDRLVINGAASIYGSTNFNPTGNDLVAGFEMVELRNFTLDGAILALTGLEELALISGRNGTTNRQDINLGNSGSITGADGAQRVYLVGVNLGSVATGDGNDTILIAGNTNIRNNTNTAIDAGEGDDVVILGGSYDDVYGEQSITRLNEELASEYDAKVDGTGGATLATNITFGGRNTRINGGGGADVLVFENEPLFNGAEPDFHNGFPFTEIETVIFRGGNYTQHRFFFLRMGNTTDFHAHRLSLEDVTINPGTLGGGIEGDDNNHTVYISGDSTLPSINLKGGTDKVYIGKRLENDGITTTDKETNLTFVGPSCSGSAWICASGGNNTLILSSATIMVNGSAFANTIASGFSFLSEQQAAPDPVLEYDSITLPPSGSGGIASGFANLVFEFDLQLENALIPAVQSITRDLALSAMRGIGRQGGIYSGQRQLDGYQSATMKTFLAPNLTAEAGYEQDITISEHGFGNTLWQSESGSQRLKAGVAVHILAGALSSGEEGYEISGQASGFYLAYEAYTLTMQFYALGAWFDIADTKDGSKTHYEAIAEGAQLLFGGRVAFDMALGGLTLTPSATIFWQDTDMDADYVYLGRKETTGMVALDAAWGSGSLRVGLAYDGDYAGYEGGTQHYQAEPAVVVGFSQTLPLAGGLQFRLEAGWRRGLNTDRESGNIRVAGALAF